MKTQYKAFGILAVSAVLAAGLFSAAKPAAASVLIHPLQIGQQTLIADHAGDWNYNGDRDHQREERRQQEIRQAEFRQAEFRRQQEIRREEERRREEWQRDHRQDFRNGDHRDRHQDNH